MDFDQPGRFSRADALNAGYTDDDLRRGRSTGELFTIRRGHFVRTDVYLALDDHARHLLLAQAVYAESSSNAVLSHVSAAVLHGMETWGAPLDKVTLTIGRSYAGKRGKHRTLHGSPLPDSDVTEVEGVAVTTPTRTVVDLARTLPLEAAVALGDHALRTGSTTATQLHSALADARTRTGIAKARQAVGHMSDRSRSVAESRSRMQLDVMPLPVPILDQWVYDESGTVVARVPFLYPGHGVACLVDGDVESPYIPDLAYSRERRELERLGWTVAHWTAALLDSPRELTTRIARAFVRAAVLPVPSGSFATADAPI